MRPVLPDVADQGVRSTVPNANPTFTIISAVYNVARYLPRFIESIEAQTHPLEDVELILVDDGSTDESLAMLEKWRARRPELVTILTQENAGQAAARNRGLEHARGTWVNFTDPDDALDPAYLAQVAKGLARWPDVAMTTTRRLIFHEDIGEVRDSHPLRRMFDHRDQVKDLDAFPEFFQNAANASFFLREHIEEHGLRFDPRIRPNFEDGHFIQRYLLRCDRRYVSFLRKAEYLYTKRADLSSTVQTGAMRPSRFTAVPRHGYLELLQEAESITGGRAPAWLQNMIIYEVSHFISPEDALKGNATVCHGPLAEEFIGLLREIRSHLDDDVIRAFASRPLRTEWYQVLLHGLDEKPWHTDHVALLRYDAAADQVLLAYRWTGREPELTVLLRGVETSPVATKIRDWDYYEHPLMHERLAWFPAAGTLRVKLDGHPVELRTGWEPKPVLQLRPAALRRTVAPQRQARPWTTGERTVGRRTRLLRRLASSRLARRYADAWTLIDHVTDGDDSAEVLFDHLRRERPDVNAWFVIDRRSADGRRVRRRHGSRVVHYGSLRWLLLMLNTKHLISSHADDPVTRPREVLDVAGSAPWTFTFLQHGVIQNDLSRWLSPKKIDLFLTSTRAEHASIVGDHNRYAFTSKETQLLGMPRLDDLRARAERLSHEPDLVLVAPSWRYWLSKPPTPESPRRKQVIDDFATTDYAENWLGLLRSEELAAACREHGLRIGFLPHPNMEAALDRIELPPEVMPLRYSDGDVRDLFTRAAVLVTDFSSVAFNTAFLERPAVYFQFDRERVEAGDHSGRRGYFSYETDGFGPVVGELEDAVEATVRATAQAGRLVAPYSDRATEAFGPVRDGKCCERVVAAVENL